MDCEMDDGEAPKDVLMAVYSGEVVGAVVVRHRDDDRCGPDRPKLVGTFCRDRAVRLLGPCEQFASLGVLRPGNAGLTADWRGDYEGAVRGAGVFENRGAVAELLGAFGLPADCSLLITDRLPLAPGAEDRFGAVRAAQNATWATSLTQQGLDRFRAGQHAGAERALLQALDVSEDFADAKVALAAVFKATGRAREARALLRGVLEREPGHGLAREYLDKLCEKEVVEY
jgi:hypothetical protein